MDRHLATCTARRDGRSVLTGRLDRGSAAVETALVLPLLLLVIFGVIDFGRLLNAQISLTQASREGVRWVALGQPGAPARVVAAAPGLSPAPTAAITACPANAAVGANATVAASYTFSFITPLGAIAGLFGGGPSGTINLTEHGGHAMRRLTLPLRRRLEALRTGHANPDSGVAAILVVVLFGTGVLLALAALTVDVGSLYAERRQLQNGADGGALAVAQDAARNCSTGPCTPSARAQTYADGNSKDGTSQVLEVCGGGWAPLAACSAQTGPTLTQCPAVPGGLTRWIRVRTATRTGGGSTLLPPWFAQTLTGAGSGGTTVLACAQAGLDAPSSLVAALPITISLCEWNNYTAGGTSYASPPPYPPYPLSSERALYYHDTTGATHCPAGPSGADLPGGFGWLDTASGTCAARINDASWVDDSTGNAIPNSCNGQLAALLGTVVYLPIYDNTNGLSGNNGSYHISGFAAFYLTGYSFPGDRQNSVASGIRYCLPSQSCVYGWFTTGLAPPGSTGGGTPRGATAVRLIG